MTSSHDPMSISATGRLTYADYCLLPDDGNRYEIIDGVLYTQSNMSPSPALKHQRALRNLAIILARYVEEKSLGEVLFAPFDIMLSDSDVVQPDLFFVSTDRGHIIAENQIQGPPDLVIEVLSEGNRRHDEIVKRKLYEQHGVSEYWIVDPVLESVKIYHMKDGRYNSPTILSSEAADVLESTLLPGFLCRLEEVFTF